MFWPGSSAHRGRRLPSRPCCSARGGEFAFVIVGLAAALGLIPFETAQFMLIVAGVTMVATPLVAQAARRVGQAVEAADVRHDRASLDPPEGFESQVVVVGYGRVGQMLGSFLDAQELPYIALDTEAGLVTRYRAAGGSVYYGDAARPDILRKCGVESALALVVTMDNPEAADRVVAAARQNWPAVPIFARARDVTHATHLIAQGASYAVPETTEASLQLSEMVLMEAGIPDSAARRLVEDRRQAEQAAVDESRERYGR